MKYNEWRDELKNNLLSVTESERKRVLDYYAEAYADRREAGFSEREIIEDFGAPYDAAQRILCDTDSDSYYEEQERPTNEKKDGRENRRHERRFCETQNRDREESHAENVEQPASAPEIAQPVKEKKTRGDYTWIFVLLCIFFSIPLFGIVMGMVGISIGVCVAPFAVIASGISTVIGGILELSNSYAGGLWSIGIGLIVVGVSVMFIPLCFKLVKLMWKLFQKFFRWLRSLFSGKKECKQ